MAVLGEIDLTRNFNPMVLIRAREYERARKVLKAHIEHGGWVYGLVKGSDATTYSQVIHYFSGPDGVLIEGDCTCPSGKNCKHVGAVLFSLISSGSFERYRESGETTPTATNPSLEKWLASVRDAAEDQSRPPDGARQELLFVIKVERSAERAIPLLQPMTAQIGRDSGWKQAQHFRLASLRAQTAPRYLRRSDVDLLKRLEAHLRSSGENASFDLSSVDAPPLLQQVLETGRCYWSNVQGMKLALGAPLQVEPVWVEDELGFQEFKLRGFKGKVLPLKPPWYIHPGKGTCGPLETGLGSQVAQALCSAPRVAPENTARVRQVLGSVLGRNSPLLPAMKAPPETLRHDPEPSLILGWVCVRQTHTSSASQKNISVPCAKLEFTYGGRAVQVDQPEIRFVEAGGSFRVFRDMQAEEAARSRIEACGWTPFEDQSRWIKASETPATHALGLDGLSVDSREQALLEFVAKCGAQLESDGWKLLWEDGSPVQSQDAKVRGTVLEHGDDLLELHVEATLADETIDLKPVLKSLGRGGLLDREGGAENYYLRSPNGLIFSIPINRLREIFATLSDLFGDLGHHELLFPKVRAVEFQALSGGLDALQFPDRVSDAIARLAEPEESEDPSLGGLASRLRPYQRDGLKWLRFLCEFGFGGILADDMGLGKTVQTLALIQSLKLEGKLGRPVLIVAPTSTLPNWQAEIKRFVPDLSALVLHGSSRKEGFEEVDAHDLVVTSYPLLVRDREVLLKRRYSLVVLDEAQNIKNPATHAAKAAFDIEADAKIALSGTPIENHLEELWSIFRFALPGLLGGQTEFRREFRTTIEGGNRASREKLERRIKPFFLRRTKEQVAPELPSKTEVVDIIPLEPSQRELYDAVALASDRKIRESILARGWDETRFEALNALLRLRQICCDPRLIKQEAVTESAKLERLLSMLRELKDAGRRTLVFSQFTSMLDLIEDRLREEQIPWVRLCGSTRDRATPVEQFQSGSVPVFLISLKAGGVGLNLTAADTVIHYDPWWNPAVERQATDRAHRIGQDKPVFVYKLVAADTVEERILALQERKAELAQLLLGGDAEWSMSAQDLRWVLTNSLG